MKIKRIKEETFYTARNRGAGVGATIPFESDLFTVRYWHLVEGQGIRTELFIRGMRYKIYFIAGAHDLTSDRLCMEQLTDKEINQLIDYCKNKSFKEGQQSKINEIRDCLEI